MEENVVQENETINEEVQEVEDNEEVSENNFEHNSESSNIQKIREAADRKLKEMARQIEELKANQMQKAVPVEEEKDKYWLSEEDIVEGKDLRKVHNKVEALEKRLRNVTVATEETTVNSQLNLDHPDFKKVMTKANVDKLLDAYPEFADTLGANTNKYTQYKSAYRLIKQFGIYKEDTNSVEKRTINTNVNKPIPSNSLGSKSSSGPLAQVGHYNGALSDDMKRELREKNRLASQNY